MFSVLSHGYRYKVMSKQIIYTPYLCFGNHGNYPVLCYRMMEDRANRFTRRINTRKRLEEDWVRASLLKRDRLEEDKVRALSPGILLHEQCDKYSRCAQCKRQMKNCGESNLWSESRYIPGSRLMV